MNIVEQIWKKSEKIQILKNELIRTIDLNQPLSFFELVYLMHLAYRNTLFFLEMLSREGKVVCTEQGICLAHSPNLKRQHKHKEIMTQKILPWSTEVRQLERNLEQIARKQPSPILLFGHRGITIESTLNRINYMLYRDDVVDKEIAFIGDNDLCSIALGLLGKSRRLCVFDIDEKLIDFLRAVCKEYSLKIEFVNYDCHNPTPVEFQNSFDVFWSDPYPTADASFEYLFWQRGLSLLRLGAGKIGYTLSMPSHKNRSHFHASQRLLTDLGLIITDVIPRMNSYKLILGELSEQEEIWLRCYAADKDVKLGIAHTKSLIRFETSNHNMNYGPDFKELKKGRDDDLSNWILNQIDNYLLLHIGVEEQLNLTLKSVTSNKRWTEAISSVGQINPPVCTLKLDLVSIFHEITGSQYSNKELSQCLDNCSEKLMQRAFANNYVLTEEEINICRLLSKGICDIPGNVDKNLFYDIYALARHFESYYR
ncbi:MAG: bis-aminopropyl spermidine synthase family protein [Desulfobacterales bacterium]|nr:bis-aminopropyl spermidine synthase family protein [Desulfobacterales bacterium]